MNDIEKIAINTRSNVVKKPTTIEEQIELLNIHFFYRKISS